MRGRRSCWPCPCLSRQGAQPTRSRPQRWRPPRPPPATTRSARMSRPVPTLRLGPCSTGLQRSVSRRCVPKARSTVRVRISPLRRHTRTSSTQLGAGCAAAGEGRESHLVRRVGVATLPSHHRPTPLEADVHVRGLTRVVRSRCQRFWCGEWPELATERAASESRGPTARIPPQDLFAPLRAGRYSSGWQADESVPP